jgi:3-mercaptopyruvate sulfurtransferase SseA
VRGEAIGHLRLAEIGQLELTDRGLPAQGFPPEGGGCNPGETEAGVIPGAIRIPLAALLDRLSELDPSATTVVYCAGGYRSSIAASALAARGFATMADILGGYDA